ncbi:uncharacterized protein F5147DRAFT_538928, partial [Suillus discolor]
LCKPTLEQLNKIMDRFVSEMIQPYSVSNIRTPRHEHKFPVDSVVNTEVSDSPASRKLEGLA